MQNGGGLDSDFSAQIPVVTASLMLQWPLELANWKQPIGPGQR